MSELPITHAIADVGGVFVRAKGEIKLIVAESLGLNPQQCDEFWSWVAEELGRGRITERELWKRTSDQFGVRTVGPAEGLLRMREITYDQEAIKNFQKLGAYGVQLSFFSNTIKSHTDQLQELYGLVPRVFLSHEIGLRKPDKASFHYVLKELNVQPDRALFFDDSAENIEAARRMGMFAIQVSGAAQIEEGMRLYVPGYQFEGS